MCQVGTEIHLRPLLKCSFHYADFHKILIIKPTRCTNFSNLFFGIKLYMFRTVPLPIIRSFSLYTQQYIQVC